MAAESFVQGRYRAYRCVVCGAYHLTSGRGDRPEPPEPPKREPPGPKLGDLDWSAVLGPSKVPDPTPTLSPDPEARIETPPSPVEIAPRLSARCVGRCSRDGRILLVVSGRLVKSRPVDRALRDRLEEGTWVEVEGEPPTVRSVGLVEP